MYCKRCFHNVSEPIDDPQKDWVCQNCNTIVFSPEGRGKMFHSPPGSLRHELDKLRQYLQLESKIHQELADIARTQKDPVGVRCGHCLSHRLKIMATEITSLLASPALKDRQD